MSVRAYRLKPEVLAITIADQSIMDICNLSIEQAIGFRQVKT